MASINLLTGSKKGYSLALTASLLTSTTVSNQSALPKKEKRTISVYITSRSIHRQPTLPASLVIHQQNFSEEDLQNIFANMSDSGPHESVISYILKNFSALT